MCCLYLSKVMSFILLDRRSSLSRRYSWKGWRRAYSNYAQEYPVDFPISWEADTPVSRCAALFIKECQSGWHFRQVCDASKVMWTECKSEKLHTNVTELQRAFKTVMSAILQCRRNNMELTKSLFDLHPCLVLTHTTCRGKPNWKVVDGKDTAHKRNLGQEESDVVMPLQEFYAIGSSVLGIRAENRLWEARGISKLSILWWVGR